MTIASLSSDKGGFDYKFVDTLLDTLVCKICYYPSRNPHLSVCCGHVFCKSCLEGAEKVTTATKACPVCRSEEFSYFPNKQADRIISGLHVHCTNYKKGCQWQGKIYNIDSHITGSEGCQFVDVSCSNHCGRYLQRQHLAGHIEYNCACRKVTCQYCGITGEHRFIEGPHKQECIKRPLLYPNKCELPTTASNLAEHLKICPLELTECEYHMVGCRTRILRQDQKKHNKETMEEHLSLTMKELLCTNSELASTAMKLPRISQKQKSNMIERSL